MLQSEKKEGVVPVCASARPEFHQLETFLRVVEARSFAGAARLMGRSQPAISQAIGRLEEIYGGDLFERRRGALLELTPIGQSILPSARIIIDTIDQQMFQAVATAQSRAGNLTLGFSPGLVHGPLRTGIADFVAASPQVRLRLVEAGPQDLRRQLNERAIDLMIVAPTLRLGSATLMQERLWEERLVMALPADHALAKKGDYPLLDWRGQWRMARLRFAALVGVLVVGIVGTGKASAMSIPLSTEHSSSLISDWVYVVDRASKVDPVKGDKSSLFQRRLGINNSEENIVWDWNIEVDRLSYCDIDHSKLVVSGCAHVPDGLVRIKRLYQYPTFYYPAGSGSRVDESKKRFRRTFYNSVDVPQDDAGSVRGVKLVSGKLKLIGTSAPHFLGGIPKDGGKDGYSDTRHSRHNAVMFVKPIEQPQDRGRYSVPLGTLIWGGIFALMAYFGKAWADYRYRHIVRDYQPNNGIDV